MRYERYEIRAEVERDFLEKISNDLGNQFNHAAAMRTLQDALAVYAWVAEESSKGRSILSADEDRKDFERLIIRDAELVRNKAIAAKKRSPKA